MLYHMLRLVLPLRIRESVASVAYAPPPVYELVSRLAGALLTRFRSTWSQPDFSLPMCVLRVLRSAASGSEDSVAFAADHA